jgi:hypothetical protein
MGPTSGLDLTILGGSYEVTLLGLFFCLLKDGGRGEGGGLAARGRRDL